MAKNYDENKVLKSISRVAKINYGNKTIHVSKNAIIGIHTQGKIDFLTKYCKWHLIWDNNAGIGGYINDSSENTVKPKNTNAKKAAKQHDLTNKNKKQSKKK